MMNVRQLWRIAKQTQIAGKAGVVAAERAVAPSADKEIVLAELIGK
jgi:hypothetical protein